MDMTYSELKHKINLLELNEVQKMEMIANYRNEDVIDILNDFIVEYNTKNKKDYQKAIDAFWES